MRKIEDISDDKNNIYCVKHLEMVLGKTESCLMTAFAGAFNKTVFNGNTLFFKKSEKNNKHRYLYIGGDMVCSFLNNDKIYKYTSNMGNNLVPHISYR